MGRVRDIKVWSRARPGNPTESERTSHAGRFSLRSRRQRNSPRRGVFQPSLGSGWKKAKPAKPATEECAHPVSVACFAGSDFVAV